MTMQASNINPRDWFNTRRINFMPRHFTRVSLETIDVFSHDEAAHWIDTNGEGRYCVVNVAQRQGEHIVQKTYAGFEDPLEASYFSLAYLATQSKRSTPF